MKNNKKKNKKDTLFNAVGSLLLGMFFILTAFNILEVEKDKMAYMETNGKPVEATIISFSRRGIKNNKKPVISYSFEGEEYTRTLNYYFFLMKKGDTVEILVDPDNPKYFIESDNTKEVALIYLMMFIGASMPAFITIPYVFRKLKV